MAVAGRGESVMKLIDEEIISNSIAEVAVPEIISSAWPLACMKEEISRIVREIGGFVDNQVYEEAANEIDR